MLAAKQKAYQQRIEKKIRDRLNDLEDHAPLLKRAMQYSMLNGGKRMRPFLIYATGEMLGAAITDLDYPALAIECIHAYSLVHDDLPAMDDDNTRRGKPTCHIAFDEASAILAGDALQTLAFDILAHADFSQGAKSNLALLRILSGASGYQGMCGGQAMDLAATDTAISQDQLQHLHNLKTGALIKASVAMAVTLSPQTEKETGAWLDKYSSALGLAFQVQDDILDVIGDSKVLGKPQGSDQAHNKSTYPALLGLEGAKDYLQQLHQQALHALDALPYNTQLLKEFTQFIVQRDY